MGPASHERPCSRSRLIAIALLVALGAGVVGSQALGAFDAPVNTTVGAAPEYVAVGDLNGDTKLDLATANTSSNNVSVLLNDGNGAFTEQPSRPTVEAVPRSVAIGSLNADSDPDLAVTNFSSNSVSVLPGNGDGTFDAATNIPTGTNPRTVAIGNLDADANPDMAITNQGSGTVSILLGQGNGMFAAAAEPTISVGSSPFGIAIGNLDGDANADLVVGRLTNDVSVLRGDGDGTFTPASGSPIQLDADSVPQSVAIGNLDGGSVPDLAVVNRDDSDVSVLLGNGDGTFGAKTDYPTGTKPQSVVIANLNGGSTADLAVATTGPDTSGPDNVSVLLGVGDGTFGAATGFPAGTDPLSVVVGTFNSYGLSDLVTANTGGNNVSFLPGTSAPTASALPGRLDFPVRDQGTTSAAQTVTVTNTSDDDDVEVSAATITAQDAADFDIAANTCSTVTLQPAETCELDITFTPSAADQRFSELEVAFNGAASPLTVTLAGVGAPDPTCPNGTIGTPPNCVPLQARISGLTVTGPAKLKKGKASTYEAAITNSGNAQATGVELAATGKGIKAGASAGTVGAGATRTVRLRLRPAKKGSRIKTTFKVTSANAGSKTVSKTVKVR